MSKRAIIKLRQFVVYVDIKYGTIVLLIWIIKLVIDFFEADLTLLVLNQKSFIYMNNSYLFR